MTNEQALLKIINAYEALEEWVVSNHSHNEHVLNLLYKIEIEKNNYF